jgi:hypothetical protein
MAKFIEATETNDVAKRQEVMNEILLSTGKTWKRCGQCSGGCEGGDQTRRQHAPVEIPP